MKVRLDLWLERNFDPPPPIRTARRWINEGKIYSLPVKMGRSYYVDEHAEYVDYSVNSRNTRGLSLVERIEIHDAEQQRARQAAVDTLVARKGSKK